MTNLERGAEHSERNREAAAIILAAPERYGGPDALLVRWAEAVSRAPAPEVRPVTHEPRQLSLGLPAEAPQ
jgi:hypothetical protein